MPKRKGETGYLESDLGRIAAQRAAIAQGTLATHRYDMGTAGRCARCGGRDFDPVHEHVEVEIVPSGRRTRFHAHRGGKTHDDEFS
jgi:hypothetical protein